MGIPVATFIAPRAGSRRDPRVMGEDHSGVEHWAGSVHECGKNYGIMAAMVKIQMTGKW